MWLPRSTRSGRRCGAVASTCAGRRWRRMGDGRWPRRPGHLGSVRLVSLPGDICAPDVSASAQLLHRSKCRFGDGVFSFLDGEEKARRVSARALFPAVVFPDSGVAVTWLPTSWILGFWIFGTVTSAYDPGRERVTCYYRLQCAVAAGVCVSHSLNLALISVSCSGITRTRAPHTRLRVHTYMEVRIYILLHPFQIIIRLTFFYPRFDHSSYLKNLCKHSQI